MATAETTMKDRLLAKLHDRSACIGVVGLGYVGLPLALEFARAGFHVIGYDVSERVVNDWIECAARLGAFDVDLPLADSRVVKLRAAPMTSPN